MSYQKNTTPNITVIKSVLAMGVLTLLSACGSGGGGGNGNSGSQPSTQATNTNTHVSQSNHSNSNWNNQLTLNDNSHLFSKENTLKVKPPAPQWQPEIDKAIAFTNQLRREKGLPDLKVDPRLAAHAQRRAEELAGFFNHTRPNGESYRTNGKDIAENIAAGKDNARETVLVQWQNSQGHYENMTGKNYKTIGLGLAVVPGSQYVYYWVQIFGLEGATSDYEFDNSAEAKQNRLYNVSQNVRGFTPAVKWLNVNGVSVHLKDIDGKGNWGNFKEGAYSGMANGYADTRFGVIRKDNDAYKVFHHGNHTTYENMPQTGTFQYVGKAVMTDGKSLNTNLDAQFKADFANKKLTGVLSEKGQSVLDINAHIRGTTFHSPQNAPVETQGSFFGQNANELAGVFHQHATGKYGAFGAKR